MPDSSAHERRERALAALAAQQYGRVATRQLQALGFHRDAIGHRVRTGRLERLHHGVYAVGHVVQSPKGNRMAATLAVRDSSLGIRSAGAHLGLRPYSGVHELVVGRGRSRRLPGIVVHRIAHLHPADLTVVDGIPTTTWARAVLDLAAVLRSGLPKVITRTEQLGLFDRRALDETIARAPRHRGTRALLATLDELHPDIALTDSDLEIAMATLTTAHGLPPARFQEKILGHRVDFSWPAQRLVVETDGWEAHRSRRAFQDDRTRDRRLQLAGYRVLRFTHADLTWRAAVVAGELRAALSL